MEDNNRIAKAKFGLENGDSIDVFPPGWNYSIDWASDEDRSKIIALNLAENRQIMNLTTSNLAKLFVLRDEDNNKRIVGWCGVDLDHDPKYPEFFSCYLLPEYRNYLLWLVLEHARSTWALSLGVTHLYLRMQNASSSVDSLKEKRLKTGIYALIEPKKLDAKFINKCQKCNLFANKCSDQIFLIVDANKMIEHVVARMGINSDPLPRFFFLKQEEMRKKNKVGPSWKRIAA